MRIGGWITFTRSLVLIIILIAANKCLGQRTKGDSLLTAFRESKENSRKISLMIALSKWNIKADFGQATLFSDSALSMSLTLNEQRLLADALTQRALIYWNNGEYDSSVSLNQKAIGIRAKVGNDSGLAENYFAIAMNYYYSADYDTAISYHQRALTLFRELKNYRRSAEVLNLIGLVYHQMGNYPEAIYYLHEFSRERQNISGYQGRTYNLGNSTPYFRSKEYFETELQLQLKALGELRSKNQNEDLYLTYLNIADTYKELRDFENALWYHQQAARFASSIGLKPEYTFLGNAYRAVGKIDSAVKIHKTATTVLTKAGTQLELLNNYINLGKDYDYLKDHSQAVFNYRMALDITTRLNNKLDIVINSHRAARALLAIGENDEAKRYAETSIKYSKRIKAKTYIRDSYQLMADIENRLKEFERAYYYQQLNKSISDSLVAGEAALQFAQMQAQFELDKKNSDIEKLNQEKKLQESRIRNKDQLIIGFIIVLVLSLWLAISTYLRFRQKSRANRILSQQKKQIEVLLSEIHHRVKNNLQIISSLLSIQSDQLSDESARMAVLEGQSRVQAMGLIHENIYRTESFAFINMSQYITKLTETLIDSFGFHDRKLQVRVETNDISVDVDTAIPLGLIINELITNSLKHAFKNTSQPFIEVILTVDKDQKLSLDVRDNGQGFLTSSNLHSFGLRLVKELAGQMGGTVNFAQRQGLAVSLCFTKFKLAA